MRPSTRVRMGSFQRARLTNEVKLGQMIARRIEKAITDECENIDVKIVGVSRITETLYPDMHFCMSDAVAVVERDCDRYNSFTVSITYEDRKGFKPCGALADSLASEILDKIGELLDESEE